MLKNIFIVLLLIISLLSCNTSLNNDSYNGNEEANIYIPKTEYGIIVDSLFVVKDKVKKNEFLADILLKYKVDYYYIDYIARYTRDTFDVRRIRSGNNYTVICDNDTSKKALYFAYEINPYRYVLYNFKDSLLVNKGVKEVVIKPDTISGEISSSLWNSIAEIGGDPNLANSLSEVYAWTIDFFGLQKGDKYTVYYEKQYVDGEYIELGKIIAANFHHIGNDNYAFYFVKNKEGDYFV